MPKTEAPPSIDLRKPGCICGQCTVPTYIGPKVEKLLVTWLPTIFGAN
jgi:hypothetical protein